MSSHAGARTSRPFRALQSAGVSFETVGRDNREVEASVTEIWRRCEIQRCAPGPGESLPRRFALSLAALDQLELRPPAGAIKLV
jgi:hypothetical protein